VNEAAWRLGIPWIDTGVLGSEMLARVNVHLPGLEQPCLECPWGPADYDAIEQEFPCGADVPAFATSSSSALGALVAALAAIECGKLMSGDLARAAIGRQVIVDARCHKLQTTVFRRRAACRFDHATWSIENLPCHLTEFTLGEACRLGGSLRIAGHRFVGALVCPQCGKVDARFRLNRPAAICGDCHRRLITPGYDAYDQLDSRLMDEHRDLSFEQLGITNGDVVSIDGRHYEVSEGA
jgi:hypothetical protein